MNGVLLGNQISVSSNLTSNRQNTIKTTGSSSPNKEDMIEPVRQISNMESATFDTEFLCSEEGKEQFDEMLEAANKIIFGKGSHFQFQIHEATGATMVKMVDNETNEVLKEFPSEKILNVIAGIWELAGIIIDEKA
jgi:flagellar protein FlaG